MKNLKDYLVNEKNNMNTAIVPDWFYDRIGLILDTIGRDHKDARELSKEIKKYGLKEDDTLEDYLLKKFDDVAEENEISFLNDKEMKNTFDDVIMSQKPDRLSPAELKIRTEVLNKIFDIMLHMNKDILVRLKNK